MEAVGEVDAAGVNELRSVSSHYFSSQENLALLSQNYCMNDSYSTQWNINKYLN